MERLNIEVLQNAINSLEIMPDQQTPLDKVTIQALREYKELRDLEEQGLLMRLPCQEGTKVYLARKCLAPSCNKCKGYLNVNNCLTQYKGRIFEQEFDIQRHLRAFEKTVFMTYESAEAALAEQENKE